MTYAPPRPRPAAAPALAAGALPRVVVVAGSVARAGASASAAMLAVSAAALGRVVHLVDAADGPDAAAGDGAQAALLGVPAAALADGAAPVSATLVLTRVAPGDTHALVAAIAGARAGADLVVVDAGSRLAGVRTVVDVARATAAGDPTSARNPAALLLVVTGSDAPALAAAYALVKACGAAGGAADGAVAAEAVVVGADATVTVAAGAHLDEAARHFLGRSLRLAAAVPDDPSLAVALGAGMTVHDAAAGSPAAAALHALAERAPAARPVARGAGAERPAPARPLLPPRPTTAALRPSAYALPSALGSATAR